MALDADNGRITLARIDERLAKVIEQQREAKLYNAQRFDVLEQKTDALQRELAQADSRYSACSATQIERWKNHEREHSELMSKRSSGVADVIAAIAAVAASFGLDALTRP